MVQYHFIFQFLIVGKSVSLILSLYTVVGFKLLFNSDKSNAVANFSSIIAPNNALALGGYAIESLIKLSMSVLLKFTNLPANILMACLVDVSDMFLGLAPYKSDYLQIVRE